MPYNPSSDHSVYTNGLSTYGADERQTSPILPATNGNYVASNGNHCPSTDKGRFVSQQALWRSQSHLQYVTRVVRRVRRSSNNAASKLKSSILAADIQDGPAIETKHDELPPEYLALDPSEQDDDNIYANDEDLKNSRPITPSPSEVLSHQMGNWFAERLKAKAQEMARERR